MRRSSRWILAWIAIVAIVASACGTSGKTTTTKPAKTATTAKTTTTSTTSTTGTSTTELGGGSTTTPGSAADKARASAANIVARDFPKGWTSEPGQTGSSSTFARCAPNVNLDKETVAKASSPDFQRVDTSEVRAISSTWILSSEAVARRMIATIAGPAFAKCTQELITSSGLKAGTATGKLSPQRVTGIADEAAGIDGQLSGIDSGTGKQATLGVSIIAIRTGDVVTVLTGAALGGTRRTDGALFQKLAQAIADRQHA